MHLCLFIVVFVTRVRVYTTKKKTNCKAVRKKSHICCQFLRKRELSKAICMHLAWDRNKEKKTRQTGNIYAHCTYASFWYGVKIIQNRWSTFVLLSIISHEILLLPPAYYISALELNSDDAWYRRCKLQRINTWFQIYSQSKQSPLSLSL
jgi:hypothetical protein